MSTLGENIADNGGLKISYDALQTWLSEHHYNDAVLPGLNMTHSQQFFLSFAQVHFIALCTVGTAGVAELKCSILEDKAAVVCISLNLSVAEQTNGPPVSQRFNNLIVCFLLTCSWLIQIEQLLIHHYRPSKEGHMNMLQYSFTPLLL